MATVEANLGAKGSETVLYYHPASYYSQKALFACYEKKLKFKVQFVDLRGEQYEPSYMKLNPKGEVPVLKDGEKIIPDSSCIIEYLEETYSDDEHPRLLPEKGTEAAKKEKELRELLDQFPSPLLTFGCVNFPELTVNSKMGFAERKLRSTIVPTIQEKLENNITTYPEFKSDYLKKKTLIESRAAEAKDIDIIKKALDDVEKMLTRMEEHLSSHKDDKESWLFSENFTWSDALLSIILHRLQFLGLWERYFADEKNPCLSQYYKRVQKRDSFKKVFCGCPVLLHLLQSSVTAKGLMTATGVAVVIGVAATGAILYQKFKK